MKTDMAESVVKLGMNEGTKYAVHGDGYISFSEMIMNLADSQTGHNNVTESLESESAIELVSYQWLLFSAGLQVPY
jgi:hypothetical protein